MVAHSTRARHVLGAAELQVFSMTELRAVADALGTLDEVAAALVNAPRFGEDYKCNAAGLIVDDLLNHISNCISLIEQVAKEAQPTSAHEAQDRAWLLIQRAARYAEKLPDLAVLATELSVSVSEMETE